VEVVVDAGARVANMGSDACGAKLEGRGRLTVSESA